MKKLKKMLAWLGTFAVGLAAVADPTVTINSVRQNYPWNNTVEINYTIANVPTDAEWYASFNVVAGGTTYKLAPADINIIGASAEDAIKAGTFDATWTAPDGISDDNASITVTLTEGGDDYMIVDLTTGDVTYEKMKSQSASNTKYNTAEYKTTKMVFRKVPAGTYYVQDSTSTTATMAKDFYIGIFEVTEAQYTLMQNSAASVTASGTTMRPQASVQYQTIRGASGVPSSFGAGLSTSSPIGKLNTLTKLVFDLPTEAMWEVAARAMPANDSSHATWKWFFASSDANLSTYAWWNSNTGDDGYGNSSAGRRVVGTKQPNEWGLYDMYGNVWEWCSDGTGTATWNQTPNVASGNGRLLRGGSYNNLSDSCRSGYRINNIYNNSYDNLGFRLARLVP